MTIGLPGSLIGFSGERSIKSVQIGFCVSEVAYLCLWFGPVAWTGTNRVESIVLRLQPQLLGPTTILLIHGTNDQTIIVQTSYLVRRWTVIRIRKTDDFWPHSRTGNSIFVTADDAKSLHLEPRDAGAFTCFSGVLISRFPRHFRSPVLPASSPCSSPVSPAALYIHRFPAFGASLPDSLNA